MGEVYGFNAGKNGAVLASATIAALLGCALNLYQEKLYIRHVERRGPEARLYASMVGGLLFPSGICIFAFSQGHGSWAGPCIGLTFVRALPFTSPSFCTLPASLMRTSQLTPLRDHSQCFTGIFTMFVATLSYLTDCYQLVSFRPLVSHAQRAISSELMIALPKLAVSVCFISSLGPIAVP